MSTSRWARACQSRASPRGRDCSSTAVFRRGRASSRTARPGAVGSMVTQLAREAGGYVIGTGRAADRQKTLDFGAQEFFDLDNDALEDVGGVDLVFDVIGGDIQKRSAD